MSHVEMCSLYLNKLGIYMYQNLCALCMGDATDVVNLEVTSIFFFSFFGYISGEQPSVLSYHLFHDFAI